MPESGDKYREHGKSGELIFVREVTKNDKTWWEFTDSDKKSRSLYLQEVVSVKSGGGRRKRNSALPATLTAEEYGAPVTITDSSGYMVTVR